MIDSDLAELEKKKARLLGGMENYLKAGGEDFDPGYSEADIKKCDDILAAFIVDLRGLGERPPEPAILNCAKRGVVELNRLNESVGGGLIETQQREELCDLILFAARQTGLITTDDVTEEWREW